MSKRQHLVAAGLALASLFGSGCGTDDMSSEKKRRVDMTTLFNSVADEFLPRYKQVMGYEVKLGGPRGTFCDDKKAPNYRCDMQAKLGLGASDHWLYAVRVGPDGCWKAKTVEKYGAYQDQVDAYREREFLAPSGREVAEMVREAKKLRVLSGCARSVQAHDDDPGAFMAQYAAQAVKREFPGPQAATTCRYLGKDKIKFAPDSWEFKCETKMENGKRYVHAISCFDSPPYKDFASCSNQDGYPRIPPRRVPGE